MTINKSQGQTFKAVGIDLTEESFTHGMLYVALSRVGSPDSLSGKIVKPVMLFIVRFLVKCKLQSLSAAFVFVVCAYLDCYDGKNVTNSLTETIFICMNVCMYASMYVCMYVSLGTVVLNSRDR